MGRVDMWGVRGGPGKLDALSAEPGPAQLMRTPLRGAKAVLRGRQAVGVPGASAISPHA